MLKKLTATGIVAAAAAGFILLGSTANADRLSVNQANHRPTRYYPGHHYGHHHFGWGRGHHRDHHRFHFHH